MLAVLTKCTKKLKNYKNSLEIIVKARVLIPAKPLADCEVTSISLPTTSGYIEVLPNHTNYVTEVGVGELKINSKETSLLYFVSGGFLEVSDGSAMVLADTIETREQIDVQRAKKAEQRAHERLNEKDDRLDVGRALQALSRANKRIEFAQSAT
jgi:F-type H+-transporting ATPase subunit epsilon